MSVPTWIDVLFRREELEYDVEEGENYKASEINRFRVSWYDLHLFASFWRVTETTKSIHTFMKTPGAFSFTKDCELHFGMLVITQAVRKVIQCDNPSTDTTTCA